jgi:hypothetical protein
MRHGPPGRAELRPRLPVSTRRLIAGLLGPAIAWALHLGFIYPLVLLACRLGTDALLHGVTLATALLALAFGASSLLALRKLPAPAEGEDRALAQARFLARAGIFSCGLFVTVIVVEGLPVFFEDPCA